MVHGAFPTVAVNVPFLSVPLSHTFGQRGPNGRVASFCRVLTFGLVSALPEGSRERERESRRGVSGARVLEANFDFPRSRRRRVSSSFFRSLETLDFTRAKLLCTPTMSRHREGRDTEKRRRGSRERPARESSIVRRSDGKKPRTRALERSEI